MSDFTDKYFTDKYIKGSCNAVIREQIQGITYILGTENIPPLFRAGYVELRQKLRNELDFRIANGTNDDSPNL